MCNGSDRRYGIILVLCVLLVSVIQYFVYKVNWIVIQFIILLDPVHFIISPMYYTCRKDDLDRILAQSV